MKAGGFYNHNLNAAGGEIVDEGMEPLKLCYQMSQLQDQLKSVADSAPHGCK